VKVTSDTCDRVFGLVLALAKRRHTVKQPLHSVECVVGEARVRGGTVLGRSLLLTPEATEDIWNSLIQNSKLKKYLRRSGKVDGFDADVTFAEEVIKTTRARRGQISAFLD